MSEEEIIKYIEDEIEDDTDTFHWFDNTPNNATRKDIEKSIQAHQGLLDLYNKEKEKNKKLIAGKFREIADKNSYIKDMYINKDKIKEYIQVFKKEGSQTSLIIASVLEDLLKED